MVLFDVSCLIVLAGSFVSVRSFVRGLFVTVLSIVRSSGACLVHMLVQSSINPYAFHQVR